MRIPALATWCLLAFELAVAGCQRCPEPLALVHGKVTFQGRPLPGGTIVFLPDTSRGTHGSIAMAEIHADGTYTLKTDDAFGATPGHHRVTIASHVAPYLAMSPPAWRAGLPTKYRDPHLSGLAVEVLPGADNSINFDLD